MNSLLVLEEDPKMQEMLRQGLGHAFQIHATNCRDQAMSFAVDRSPAAILVDLNSGNTKNLEFCEKLRSHALTRNIPILVMTCNGTAETMINAYSAGVDDYFSKPLPLKEIEFRIKARIRRLREMNLRHPTLGNLVLYEERNEVEVSGKPVRLSPLEFQLLRVFLANPERMISRDDLLRSVWGSSTVSLRTVDVHVSSLRRKIVDFAYTIHSVYGSGYVLRQNENVPTAARRP